MRKKTGRWVRVMTLALLGAWSAALLVGCDSGESEPEESPSPSVVTETSEEPSEEPDGDPNATEDTEPTGNGEQGISSPPPPPTDTDGGEQTPKSNPSLTPLAPEPQDKSPEPAGT
ncbi:hypothetical protein [Streptomyces sp.]|uniref:hypothetical protein n=1 Tax=Streptomyces sp. TaxID=1931 RepID=UPI002F922A2C